MRRNAARLTALVFLLWVGLAAAKPQYVLANDPNVPPCVQVDYRPLCPYANALDPNLAGLAVLGPVPYEPNRWDVEFGLFTRPLYPCDQDGDPVVVTKVASNCAEWTIEYNDNTGWHLTAECLPGVCWWRVRVTDIRSWGDEKSRDVVIVAHVARPINHTPALAWLQLHRLQRRFMAWCKPAGWDGRDRMAPAAVAWLADQAGR